MIFHVVEAAAWEARQNDSVLAAPGPEGFVHCCDERQLAHVYGPIPTSAIRSVQLLTAD